MAYQSLPGFDVFEFSHDGISHPVYRKQAEGRAAVLIMQEIPGITPETVALAQRLHADGFSIYLPFMFGELNVPAQIGKNMVRLCISREFTLLANRGVSPITVWLRALCRRMQEDTGAPVGAIGMCLTGGFVLALMVDAAVAAPVMTQPSHGGGFGTAAASASLGMPDDIVNAAANRSHSENVPVLGIRYDLDPMCSKARFDSMSRKFGENFRRIEIDRSLYAKYRIPRSAHSVLTIDFVDQPGHPSRDAYDQMVGFLHERLDPLLPKQG